MPEELQDEDEVAGTHRRRVMPILEKVKSRMRAGDEFREVRFCYPDAVVRKMKEVAAAVGCSMNALGLTYTDFGFREGGYKSVEDLVPDYASYFGGPLPRKNVGRKRGGLTESMASPQPFCPRIRLIFRRIRHLAG